MPPSENGLEAPAPLDWYVVKPIESTARWLASSILGTAEACALNSLVVSRLPGEENDHGPGSEVVSNPCADALVQALAAHPVGSDAMAAFMASRRVMGQPSGPSAC